MATIITCDEITVGDTVILEPDRWGTGLNPNGTLIAILRLKGNASLGRIKWFDNDEYEQFLVVSTSKIEDCLLIVLPHERQYQFKGDKGSIFKYSETTFFNRRCIVTYPYFVQQISSVSLYSTDTISKLILREIAILPTRRERN